MGRRGDRGDHESSHSKKMDGYWGERERGENKKLFRMLI